MGLYAVSSLELRLELFLQTNLFILDYDFEDMPNM